MYTGNYPQMMAAYNRWMNDKLYAVCAQLTDEERKRDRGAFFKSIHGTLNHILWGDRAWLGRFDGNSYPNGPIGEWLHEDFEALRRVRGEMDLAIESWAASVDDAWLQAPLTWTSKLYSITRTQPRWTLVTQLFNHQTHHRGQVTTLLSQQGLDVGVTDLPMLPLFAEPA